MLVMLQEKPPMIRITLVFYFETHAMLNKEIIPATWHCHVISPNSLHAFQKEPFFKRAVQETYCARPHGCRAGRCLAPTISN